MGSWALSKNETEKKYEINKTISAYVSPSSSWPNRSGIGDVSATVRTQSLDCPVGVEVATICRSAVSHNNSRPEVEDVASFTGMSVSSCSIALFFDFALLPLSSFLSREFGDEDASGDLRSEGSGAVTQEKFAGGVDLFSSTEEQKSCPSRSKTFSFCLDVDPCRRLRFSP